jgi:integrase/recombinase XerD
MTLETYLQQYYSPKTAKAYQREIEAYLSNNPNAETYHYKEITHYLGILRKRYSKAATLNRILSSIKAYYSFLAHSGTRKDNPSKSIQLKDRQSRDVQLQDLFSIEELETLMQAKAERYTNLSYRNKVLISLLIYQALKPSEIAELKCEEINLEAATVYIKSSPKNNSRTLSLKANQILLFKRYLEETRPKLLHNHQELIFLIGHRGEPMQGEDITKHIKRSYGKIYKPRKVTAQAIRQSVITNLLKQNHDLRIVQSFAGHKYPSATERYKQADVEALQTALQQYHPMK